MIDTQDLPTRTVSFNYLSPDCASSNTKPYRLFGIPSTPDIPETNIVLVRRDAAIHDLRGHDGRLNLEKDAFQLMQWPHSIKATATPDEALAYAEDMAGEVQRETKADKVFVIDCQFRLNNSATRESKRGLYKPDFEPPLNHVHLDQTKSGGWKRIGRHLTQSEASEYLKGTHRVRVVNIWRPLNSVVEDSPLALCHPASVNDLDLVAADYVDEEGSGETYFLQHNPQHKWFWTSAMKRNEAYIFTTFDSTCPDGGTNCCPHTAFEDPFCQPGAAPRESVELRVVVLNRVAHAA